MSATPKTGRFARLLEDEAPPPEATRLARPIAGPAKGAAADPIRLDRRAAGANPTPPVARPAARPKSTVPPKPAPAPAAQAAPKRAGFAAEHVGLIISALLLGFGWVAPLTDYLTPRSGAGYWLGIVGGSLMLLLMVYPLRKRIQSLGFLGSNKFWFRFHMILGVAGPICIIYHCCYRLGAANSNVALVSMLIVAGSGLIGRYLYTRIHNGLYGHKVSLQELRAEAEQLKQQADGISRVLPEFTAHLDKKEKRISSGLWLVPKAISAAALYYIGRVSMRNYVRRTLRSAAANSRPIAWHRDALAVSADRYAESRLMASRRVAEFASCERLFGLWHVMHVPLFGMLLVAGIVHVIAVNVY